MSGERGGTSRIEAVAGHACSDGQDTARNPVGHGSIGGAGARADRCVALVELALKTVSDEAVIRVQVVHETELRSEKHRQRQGRQRAQG